MEHIDFNPSIEGIEIDLNYSNRMGFVEDFLGKNLTMPTLNNEQLQLVSTIKGTDEYRLKYNHFTLVMNKKRKLPFFTAVNIDGVAYEKLKDQVPSRKEIGKDKWFIDPRINEGDQIPKDFYKGNDFDLGHLVRREDPLWGATLADALKGNNDSFHLTNAAPQHSDFNQNAERWLGLENYIIKNSRHKEHIMRVNVFTGPIFNDKDYEYNYNGIKVKVPAQFWKVITMVKENGTISSTGYIITQFDLIENMARESFAFGQFLTYQRPIHIIEELTGLEFNLNEYDPMLQLKANFEQEGFLIETPRLINRNIDIIL